ncbi:terpene synthase family protein [Microbispora sp. ATCC PTA-5024]|uniref:terpene synthase family protein n=1 Tax=Microbispora sp. ATCC PTA-5024 TaxID=316330 RepID=UPI0003DCD8CA|nr:hypothetical protein [Microbispora sp. ATCC PTA-5024]ETK32302.1 hypothetical protein MPTA5024_30380 [Microbispora sp. ATCC PTA-5024]
MASTPDIFSTSGPLYVPPLPCPFPSEINPSVAEIDRESHEWLRDSGMLGETALVHFRRSKIGWLAARTNPLVPAESLRLLNDWYNWLFAFDDVFCESERLGRRAATLARALPPLFDILDERREPDADDSIGLPLRELMSRIAKAGTPAQMDRWRITVREYLFAQIWEAANREGDLIPGVEEYLLMRRYTGATYTCFALIDVAGGYALDADEWHHPDVRALSDLACDLIGWDNDLLSYAKELGNDGARHNLVTVLMAHRTGSLQAALEEVVVMHNHALAAFVQHRASAERWASERVRRYVRSLEHWVHGHIDFSLASARYIQAWPRGTRWGAARPLADRMG